MKWKEFMVPTNEIVHSSVHKACVSQNVDTAQRHGNKSWVRTTNSKVYFTT